MDRGTLVDGLVADYRWAHAALLDLSGRTHPAEFRYAQHGVMRHATTVFARGLGKNTVSLGYAL